MSGSYLWGGLVEDLGFPKVEDVLVVLMEEKHHVDAGAAHETQKQEIPQGHESEKRPPHCRVYWEEVTIPVTSTRL